MKSKPLLVVLAGLALAAVPCHALTVTLNQVAVGSVIPGTGVTNLGVNTAFMHPSTGNYAAVVRAAADYWQTIYSFLASDSLTINWGFADNATVVANAGAAGAVAYSKPTTVGGTHNLIQVGAVVINRNPSLNGVNNGWYVDADPSSWSEYPGGGVVNSTQIPYFGHSGQFVEDERFTNQDTSGSGNVIWVDLYTTITHEIGHMLGMARGYSRYDSEVTDGDIDVTSPRPIPGLAWMSSGGHLTFSGQPNSLMAPSGLPGKRKWPSQADVSCIAQIEGWWVGSWTGSVNGVSGPGPGSPSNLNPPH